MTLKVGKNGVIIKIVTTTKVSYVDLTNVKSLSTFGGKNLVITYNDDTFECFECNNNKELLDNYTIIYNLLNKQKEMEDIKNVY